MDFINAPVGLSILSFVVHHHADNASGKGLPITEKLRPLIASQTSLTVRFGSRADLLDSSHNRWNWFRNYGYRYLGHYFQKFQDRYCQPRNETSPGNCRYAEH